MQESRISSDANSIIRKHQNPKQSRGQSQFANTDIQGLRQHIRSDSPRTREACLQLGIRIEQFEQKQIEDFDGEDGDQELRKLRFNHYLKKQQSDMIQVLKKRQEIIDSPNLNLNQESIMNPSQRRTASSCMHGSTDYRMSRFSQRDLKNIQQKASQYLRNTHTSPKINNPEEIIDEIKEGEVMGSLLGQELKKYNDEKTKKQKEALKQYEFDMKKMKIVEEIQRKEELWLKQLSKLKKGKDAKKKDAQEKELTKNEQIKDLQNMQLQQQDEELDKINQRLEKWRAKMQIEDAQKQQMAHLRQEKLIEKQQKIMHFKQECDQRELEQQIQQLNQIYQKQDEAFEKYKQKKIEKSDQIRQKISMEQSKIVGNQQINGLQEEERIKQLVNNLQSATKRSQKSLIMQDKKFYDKKEKEKDHVELFKDRLNKVNEQNQHKYDRYGEIFEKVEENLQKKRENDHNKLLMKREMDQLKQQDTIEMVKRKARKEDYFKNQIVSKNQEEQERILQMKQQKQFILQTRIDIALQTKIEQERIQKVYKNFSNKLFPSMPFEVTKTSFLSPQEKKIGLNQLKQIFNEDTLNHVQDDYMSFFSAPKKQEVQKLQ